MVSGTVAIHRADILPSPKDGRTLYFSERLQTGLFDEINNRFPQLYAGITRWIEERFQEELRSWQMGRDPRAVPGTAPAPQGGPGGAPAAVQRNACVVPAIQQPDIFASVPQSRSHLSVSTAAPAVNHHPIAGAQLPFDRQPYASPPHYAGGYGSQQPTYPPSSESARHYPPFSVATQPGPAFRTHTNGGVLRRMQRSSLQPMMCRCTICFATHRRERIRSLRRGIRLPLSRASSRRRCRASHASVRPRRRAPPTRRCRHAPVGPAIGSRGRWATEECHPSPSRRTSWSRW